MNRRRLYWILVMALSLAAAGLALWLPRYAAAHRVSDLYRTYADNPHLTVAHIEDFPVNDTLTVNVTTLTALDSVGWESLKSDFSIPKLPDFFQHEIDGGKDLILTYLAPKEDPRLGMDTIDMCNNNVIGISYIKRSVSVFYTETESQQDDVLHYNLKLSK